jgi:hypothetical protein
LGALFIATPVFQCAPVVLTAGIENDRNLFLTALATLAPLVLSPVFDGAGVGLMAFADAG